MFALQKSPVKASARRQIDIKSVKDGILQLAKNRYRMVLEVPSINFELKSEAEQDALIDTYESFLNALPCPIQIVVRIRELDMDNYLADLKQKVVAEKEDIYRSQIRHYSAFVQRLVANNKILSRRFYVVLPYQATADDFDSAKEQLQLNADLVSKGLMRMGMQTRQLTSLEVLDLFHSFYNPIQAKRQPISEHVVELLNSAYVRGKHD